ncbi:MAG: hypothetical protein RQ833_01530 [Sphingomonadaceae bacterium]|nr:hypothetical protein [Sphingomonadaceae bacterium]
MATSYARATEHEGFMRHRGYRWLKLSAILIALCIATYAMADVQPRPNGGTWVGYTLGTIGVLLILWLSLLGVRKRAITPGKWSLKAWTSAHVYLGLSLIVIGTLHTGFQFGWNVHTLAYGLMMLVILSGIYGVIAYDTLPRALSDNRSEMTQRQMLDAIAGLDRQLHEAALPLPAEEAELVEGSIRRTRLGGGLFERLSGRSPRCGNVRALRELGARLDRERGSPRSEMLSRVVALLDRKEQALELARRHIQIRARLEVWLFVHVPATFALIAALGAHIFSVFYYW